MTRLCTICARGGSKGVKGKNVRTLAGRPLIAHSVEQAKASGLFDLVAISTDSAEIWEAAKAAGADLLVERPAELATDTAAKLPVIRHCVAEVEARTGRRFDTLVDLDATSPLRDPADIVDCVRLIEEEGAGNVVTAMPARRSPYFNMIELDAEGRVRLSKPPTTAIVTRQSAPKCYDMNASIYVWTHAALFDRDGLFHDDTRLHVMPEERSIDIDGEVDFLLVELLVARREGGTP